MVPLMVEGEGCKAFLTHKTLTVKSGDACIILKGEVWETIRKAVEEGGGSVEHRHPSEH